MGQFLVRLAALGLLATVTSASAAPETPVAPVAAALQVSKPAAAPPSAAPVFTFVADPSDPVARAFAVWLEADPNRAAAVGRFAAYLKSEGVGDVAPLPQLLLTASDWERCGASEFDLPPEADWPHIVPTLRYIQDRVVPAVGPVTVRSGWRPATLNKCAGGAPKGAHPDYFALDMTPVGDLSRGELHQRLCAMWREDGRAHDVGLGLYGGVRFHIDTMRWRQWKTGPGGSVAACPASIA